MSLYSGKCDVYDSLVMIREVTDFSKIKIYRHVGEIVPLRIDSQKDLVPFYPFLTPMMAGDKDGATVYLSDMSFVDMEESEILERHLNDLKRYWRKCKRKKVQFDDEEALKLICWFTPQEHDKELVRRVKQDGEKATAEDVHIDGWDRMRKDLADEMLRWGWDKLKTYTWCYGWSRGWRMLQDEKS